MKINSESLMFKPSSIEVIEKHYDAKYIYETELIAGGPLGIIFYQENPPNNYSNWLGLYKKHGDLYVTSAEKIALQGVDAICVGDDEWIYSHYTHHFLEKNGIAIDGGRSYTKILGEDILNIEKAKFMPTKNGLVKV
jgi:hypothetical protein